MSPVTLVSFDIDGTLEIGDPPGIITIGAVHTARRLGYLVGTCSDGWSLTSVTSGSGWP